MLRIDVDLLLGAYYATSYCDRNQGEWPPHPARLFCALVAAYHGVPDPADDERAALEWLERQDPPHISASSASQRDAVQVFVPVNDATVTGDLEADAAALAQLEVAAATDPRAQGALAAARKRFGEKMQRAIAVSKASAEGLRTAESLLPERRLRKVRTFPAMLPQQPKVAFLWPQAAPTPTLLAALTRLCVRVARLGHSSSLVALRVSQQAAADPSFVPDDGGEVRLRVPRRGQLAQLEDAFPQHRETEPRVMPSGFQRYRAGQAPPQPPPRSLFGEDWLVLNCSALDPERPGAEGRRPWLPISSAVGLARMLRSALLSHCGAAVDPIPEVLSGHTADRGPSPRPHLAVVPLPNVGNRHAQGQLLGVALVLPRGATEEERRALRRAVAAWVRHAQAEAEQRGTPTGGADGALPLLPLKLGGTGLLRLQVQEERSPLRGLQAETWARAALRWGTATPIALDRNPGELWSGTAAQRTAAHQRARQGIEAACARIGLPAPLRIELQRGPVLAGSAPVAAFPAYPPGQKGPRRVLVHARLTFAAPVQGPMLLGAGRHFGLGLLRPLPAAEQDPPEGQEEAEQERKGASHG